MKHNELAGIDIAKFWFCLCVVAMHSRLLEALPDIICFYASKLFLLPAVPFFFVASGFFLGRKIEQKGTNRAIKEYCMRMLPILIVFETIAILTNIIAYYRTGVEVREIFLRVFKAILFYPWGSMWYIWACIVGALIILLFEKLKLSINTMAILGGGLYMIGLLLYSYSFLMQYIEADFLVKWYMDIFVSHRNGVLFGFPLIMMGYFIQNKRYVEKIDVKQIDSILLISIILMIVEVSVLEQTDDFIISELVFAPVLFIRIAKQKKVSTSIYTRLLRKLSVGIYVLHRPLMTIWGAILRRINVSEYNIVLFLVTLISAVAICMIIYIKIPRLKKLVS